ncbi:polysaccharide deacetylase family protein [Natronosalvus halobius]|uniref:polysaccharide deacetylase family protein n=1 Tax=Natronosalvus halobius TaxID=2953746 RepID=UPI00209FF2CA|nr:polysaccharide deacetylase [Natronosalvus halobius]USZ71867.1 polysaccharide deacetylase [Natronosalvus halobius]
MQPSSRRKLLAALGAGSASLAGCLDMIPGGDPRDGNGNGNGNGTSGNGNGNGDSDRTGNGEDEGSIAWPATDTGEPIDTFENLEHWRTTEGTIDAAPDEARTGSQAAVLESDTNQVVATTAFPDRLDLGGYDVSLAVKVESATRVALEVETGNRDNRLKSIRVIPGGYEGWLRIDFGYGQKYGELDLPNVTRLNIIGYGPEDGPTKLVVDDLRKTQGVDNGKAILAFYGGHSSQYERAAPMLEERGLSAAVAVDPERIGGRNQMTLEQLEELQDQGWDVCAYPESQGALPEMPIERQERVLEHTRAALEQHGFENGARHFVVPDDRMTQETHEALREHYESGLLFGGGPTSGNPTSIHTLPQIWGPALHEGVRRHINNVDQWNQLSILRIPRIVEGESTSSSMSVDDLEHLLDHIEQRGVDVVTLSDVVDGNLGGGGDGDGGDGEEDEPAERPEGTIFESGRSLSFDGDGSTTSDSFDLSEGILVGDVSVDGDFVARLQPSDGSLADDLLVQTAGGADGESMMVVGEGSYELDIEADGEWSIDLDQPEVHADDLTDIPTSASGTGPSFVGPLWTEDDLSLEVTHSGDGTFIVDGWGADGSWEQLVNRSGEFQGSRSYAAANVCWIDVEADDDWSLEIE